jgi:hypothetical protein
MAVGAARQREALAKNEASAYRSTANPYPTTPGIHCLFWLSVIAAIVVVSTILISPRKIISR